MASETLRRRNRMLLGGLVGFAFLMVGVSFAAVPLYDLFCRVTGFGGTTQVGDDTADVVLDRTMRVRFTADTDRNLPWSFRPETRELTLRIGEPALVYYEAVNTSDQPVAGMATYNVSPAKAGIYFVKVQCFCFNEQVLMPGQRMQMPVYFYVDPALAQDVNLDDVQVITLSYTFFQAVNQPGPQAALIPAGN